MKILAIIQVIVISALISWNISITRQVGNLIFEKADSSHMMHMVGIVQQQVFSVQDKLEERIANVERDNDSIKFVLGIKSPEKEPVVEESEEE